MNWIEFELKLFVWRKCHWYRWPRLWTTSPRWGWFTATWRHETSSSARANMTPTSLTFRRPNSPTSACPDIRTPTTIIGCRTVPEQRLFRYAGFHRRHYSAAGTRRRVTPGRTEFCCGRSTVDRRWRDRSSTTPTSNWSTRWLVERVRDRPCRVSAAVRRRRTPWWRSVGRTCRFVDLASAPSLTVWTNHAVMTTLWTPPRPEVATVPGSRSSLPWPNHHISRRPVGRRRFVPPAALSGRLGVLARRGDHSFLRPVRPPAIHCRRPTARWCFDRTPSLALTAQTSMFSCD